MAVHLYNVKPSNGGSSRPTFMNRILIVGGLIVVVSAAGFVALAVRPGAVFRKTPLPHRLYSRPTTLLALANQQITRASRPIREDTTSCRQVRGREPTRRPFVYPLSSLPICPPRLAPNCDAWAARFRRRTERESLTMSSRGDSSRI
jgi:hypothetical protein